jgi:hypothetical protein
MQELKVQSYLRSGKSLEDLDREYHVSAKKAEGLVVLNYDQIESVKNDPIVMECRSTILEEGTWDLVSMTFYRFFNYGEGEPLELNLDNSYALEKIDGSLIHYFMYKGRRLMSTRSMIGGSGPTNIEGTTFKDVFDKAVARHPNFHKGTLDEMNYVFELVSPETTIVTPYDFPDLYLLTARRNIDHAEVDLPVLNVLAEKMGVKTPKYYSFTSLESVAKMAADLPRVVDEGYVCVDYSWSLPCNSHYRVKVKNPSYVAIAHIRDKACSTRSMFELVMTGEEEELLSYLPYFKVYIDRIKEKTIPYIKQAELEMQDITSKFVLDEVKNDRTLRGEFAKMAKSSVCPPYLFSCLENGPMSFREYFMNEVSRLMRGSKPTTERAARKHVAMRMMEAIGVKRCGLSEETI